MAGCRSVGFRGLAGLAGHRGPFGVSGAVTVAVALLLGHGANPNGGSRKGAPANEPSLVERFARYGYDALIRIVLDAGADLALHPHALGVACQYAVTTPSEGHDDAVALLLQRGADPTAALLHLALHLQPNDIEQKTLRILLELGANPNALSASQETPLAIVVKRGLHRHARLLIEKGANVHVRVGGETLYEVAQRSYKAGVSDARLVMQLLKELGVGPVLADAPKPVDVAAPSGPQAGARVAHSKFGGGVITKVDKDMLDVTFDSGEKKSLLAKFVKLL